MPEEQNNTPETPPVVAPAPAAPVEPAPAPVAAAPEAGAPPVEPPKPAESAPSAKADPELNLNDLLADPTIARALKDRETKAVAAAVATAKKTAETIAERSKMEEADRLRAEKADETTKREAAESRADKLQIDRDFNDAFLKTGTQLANPTSIDFIRGEARRVMEDEGLAMETCVKDVLEKHAYLVRAEAPVAPVVDPSAPITPPAPAAPARTTPPVQAKHTETPSAPEPKKLIDTREMGREEYVKYRRETHGF